MKTNGTRSERRNRRQHRTKNDDAIVIDSDEDDDVAVVDEKHRKPASSASSSSAAVPTKKKSSRKIAAAPCIDLLESDGSDEENHPNRPLRHRRKNKRKPSPSAVAEAADRDLAKRLQREENAAAAKVADRKLAERLQREENAAAAKAASIARRERREASKSSAAVRDDVEKCREERKLRNEQDGEYQQALLADEIKDIRRMEAEEKERREKEGTEDEEALEKAREASLLSDARSLIETAGGEPPVESDGVTRLRFALPDGKRVDRRFRSTDTVTFVRAFLIVHFAERGIGIKNIGFSTNFPKRAFDVRGDGHLTLEKAGLAPQALLMVMDMDS